MYLWHKHVLELDDKFTFQEFQLQCCEQVKMARDKQIIVPSTSDHTLIYPVLKHGEQRRCVIKNCNRKVVTYCDHCPMIEGNYQHMCEGLCNIMYHNPNINIQEH